MELPAKKRTCKAQFLLYRQIQLPQNSSDACGNQTDPLTEKLGRFTKGTGLVCAKATVPVELPTREGRK